MKKFNSTKYYFSIWFIMMGFALCLAAFFMSVNQTGMFILWMLGIIFYNIGFGFLYNFVEKLKEDHDEIKYLDERVKYLETRLINLEEQNEAQSTTNS